jgi:hypothetical protein
MLMAVSFLDRYSLGRCPQFFSLLAARSDPVMEHKGETFIPAHFHSVSNVSAKAEMKKRNNSGAMLSPCLTPTV